MKSKIIFAFAFVMFLLARSSIAMVSQKPELQKPHEDLITETTWVAVSVLKCREFTITEVETIGQLKQRNIGLVDFKDERFMAFEFAEDNSIKEFEILLDRKWMAYPRVISQVEFLRILGLLVTNSDQFNTAVLSECARFYLEKRNTQK